MPAALLEHLAQRLAGHRAALCVGYSGGPDSSALLHALAQLPAARQHGLRAVHIDHGLHAHSAAWAEHCQAQCEAWQIACRVIRVQVPRGEGQGLEAAARQARYAAFTAQLDAGERLVLAHHRDDQAETVLLKLLRGAGPEGLGGMREQRPLGHGQLWRPLLELPRAVLATYVAEQQLACIDDPSNADIGLSRNYLRREILPRLSARWPQAVSSILHSATLSRTAAGLLREQWLDAFSRLHDPATGSLEADAWLALPPALAQPLLDHWLHGQHLPVPGHLQRREIERQQRRAGADRLPCVRWPGAELHLWRGRWWATPPLAPAPAGWQADWQGEALTLPGGGQLSLRRGDGTIARLAAPLQLRLRRGGERLKPAGDAHTRELRDLFQSGALPPWLRPCCPLIYQGETLIAVADRWCSERAAELFANAGGKPHWRAL